MFNSDAPINFVLGTCGDSQCLAYTPYALSFAEGGVGPYLLLLAGQAVSLLALVVAIDQGFLRATCFRMLVLDSNEIEDDNVTAERLAISRESTDRFCAETRLSDMYT